MQTDMPRLRTHCYLRALQQGAALCRLAVVARFSLHDYMTRQQGRDTSAPLKWNGWAAAVAAALSAAASWAEATRSQAYVDGTAGNTGSGNGSAPGVRNQLMSRQRQQLLQCCQHAAFHLGKAAETTLLPAAADVDAMEQRLLVDLLDSSAALSQTPCSCLCRCAASLLHTN